MICIFCKGTAGPFTTVEHIIPESLGNRSHTLPPGIVCDRCNNYFGAKVEGPLLASPSFTALRFHQVVPSKKNRVPPIDALLLPGHPVELVRPPDPLGMPSLGVTPAAFERILLDSRNGRQSTLVFPVGSDPDPGLLSRFLAKCAVEALASRILPVPGAIAELALDTQFDPIRDHARRGAPRRWAFSDRMIYAPNAMARTEEGQPVQTLFEFDLLMTTPERTDGEGRVVSELYFVLAVFGREFAINMAAPEMEGYETWLNENGHRSPLYWGRNAGLPVPTLPLIE